MEENGQNIMYLLCPRFPVNLDVVTVQNFDAVQARKYFIVCVPTVYGKHCLWNVFVVV